MDPSFKAHMKKIAPELKRKLAKKKGKDKREDKAIDNFIKRLTNFEEGGDGSLDE